MIYFPSIFDLAVCWELPTVYIVHSAHPCFPLLLNTANAFFSLHYHGVPECLARLVANCLELRTVSYKVQDEYLRRRSMCSVPQIAVFGILL